METLPQKYEIDKSNEEELIKANDELSGISDIILTEYNKPFELSGQTNNN